MITLTTNEGSIIANINGKFDRTIPKGKFSVVNTHNGYIVLDYPSPYSALKLSIDTTLDGVSYDTLEDLADALSAFSDGGGDGDGVTQEELNERVPVLPLNNFLVGGVDGNEGRTIQSTDLGYTTGGGLRIVSILNGALTTPFPASSSILNSSAVVRTGGGQGKFSPSSTADEAVVQSQFEGAVNDTLTSSETSATLNTAYPNVVVGFTVTAGTTEYKKKSPTAWTKKTIENV